MAKYRDALPQLSGDIFLTDGGLETTLVFHHDIELPHFASFVLLATEDGRTILRDYFRPYTAIAREAGVGLILESSSWRANPDWGAKIGYSPEALADANRRSIELCAEVREQPDNAAVAMPISGCLGPRGDGYQAGEMMTIEQAADYHRWQIEIFRETGADFISALTMTYANEAAGIALAARAAGMPSAISFTLETDGRLPDGSTLAEAIAFVDDAADQAPAYYMINCAHPTHFGDSLEAGSRWVDRIRGIRANASRLSHAELDEAEELDEGNPSELGAEFRDLRARFPQLNVLGGCCGTDHRHIAAISGSCGLPA